MPKNTDELITTILTTAPVEELLTDRQVEKWLGIPAGTQAAQRKQGTGILADCTIYVGPRTPRVLKAELTRKLPSLLGKGWVP